MQKKPRILVSAALGVVFCLLLSRAGTGLAEELVANGSSPSEAELPAAVANDSAELPANYAGEHGGRLTFWTASLWADRCPGTLSRGAEPVTLCSWQGGNALEVPAVAPDTTIVTNGGRFLLAGIAEPADDSPPSPQPSDDEEQLSFLRQAPSIYGRQSAVRFGWWAVDASGDPTKVGEYQDLESAPFWDFDILMSNGVRTIDLFGTGLDQEGNQAGLYFFDPRLSGKVGYQRYLRRRDHDPLTNMGTPGGDDEIVAEDLNVGADYAIRVQELNAHIKGRLTKRVKFRVNFWMLRKNGERQANATQHCAGTGWDPRTCHVLSQRQTIDWLTCKLEPVIEGDFGPVRVEYSRPMRIFSQGDGIVTRSYGDFHVYDYGGEYPYGVVPDNFTQIDRVKVAADLSSNLHFYGRLHTGDTHNKHRETHRRFYGSDLRLTFDPWDQVTTTGYFRWYQQENQFPPFLLAPEINATSDTTVGGSPLYTSIIPPYGLRRPINYTRTSAGIEATWRPPRWRELARGLTINGGFEYGWLLRSFAEYYTQEPPRVFDQRHTDYTAYFVGTSWGWTPRLKTFLRYRGRQYTDPLYGVNMYSGITNTSLPERQDIVEFGGSWVPWENFLATFTVGIENRSHSSEIAKFEEDNYPLTFTVWYAPTPKWSLSAGYGHYTNWIDQEIYFPSDTPGVSPYDRREWNYGGVGRVVNLGVAYAWTPRLSLSGGYEYVWADNSIDPLAPWPDLPYYFDVVVQRTRLTGGIDYYVNQSISAYLRYQFEDYEDLSVAYNSGTAHMFLAGLVGRY